MAIEKMMLVNILGEIGSIDKVLEKACLDDEFHPESTLAFLDNTEGYLPITDENPYSPMLQALEELSKSHSPPLRFVDFNRKDFDREKLQNHINHISGGFQQLNERVTLLKEDINATEIALEQLSHFIDLDLRLDKIFACQFTKVRFGRIPKDSFPKLAAYEDNPYLVFFPGSVDQTHYWGVYFCPADQSQKIDRIFSNLYFERLRIPDVNGTPQDGIKQIQAVLDAKKREMEQITAHIQLAWEEQYVNIEQLYSFITYLNDAAELRRYAARYGHLFHLVGWIPERKRAEFEQRYAEMSQVELVFEAPEEIQQDPPVKLKNNRFSKPFELFVEMFGLPDYKEIDPTVFLSFTFCLFFGIMFADLGQGIVLFFAGLFMKKKMKMPIGAVLMRTSIFSCVFGCVFGSVFGYEDLLNPIYERVGLQPFHILESSHIAMILIIAIGIGCVLNGVAIGINIYSSLKRKRYADALFGPNGVAGFIFYAALITAGVLLFAAGINLFTPPYLLGLIILPLLVIFFKEPLGALVEHKTKLFEGTVGEFISGNFFELFESLLSYMSNTISFLRVGAFVLVHVGMMRVVFVIAGLFGPFGYVVSMVVGNILVLGLEALLVSIQCMRLEYYEMFSRFYSGTGTAFASIRTRRRDSG